MSTGESTMIWGWPCCVRSAIRDHAIGQAGQAIRDGNVIIRFSLQAPGIDTCPSPIRRQDR